MEAEITDNCPICGGAIPNEEHKGKYPGALSRYDNEGSLLATDKYPKTMLVFVPFKK